MTKTPEELTADWKAGELVVSVEIMTWQIRGGEESHKRGQNLLTCINAAIGDNEI